MDETMKRLGLYIHIPFCRSKCFYCDFCSLPRSTDERIEAYVRALLRDLAQKSADCRAYTVDTVYLGGGTPTLLPAEALGRILDMIASRYSLSADTEITAECNPATADADAFSLMRRAGFNRLSVGVQSVHECELRALGRIHSFRDVCDTWENAVRAGFSNLSADVMFGIPEQTEDSYLATLERVCALSPKHLSAYGLTVEEGTPFGEREREGRLVLPDEEETRRMYFSGAEYLASVGFEQYEISNFAKTGYESRHNLKYWNSEEYLGFGPAAHSDFFGARTGNSEDIDAYIEGRDIFEVCERPSQTERMNEYVMLRLRLRDGISAAAFGERFGEDLEETFGNALGRYVSDGFVRRTEDGYAFTPQGWYVSNAILSEILDFSGT